ncbi:hypothetical protein BCR44DRAFT_351280 [Catenaria anguillulae PL171]|uniref:SWIM-type domain-containing protein n=1 Tax=Catenaria anguillulae PL171 TaxID=765915 RepID=A0A1Y2HBJ6_9FUNG|nr:hypothetical protein BCR44DRAFT_351280 [Catenaria anguillulae PL171]
MGAVCMELSGGAIFHQWSCGCGLGIHDTCSENALSLTCAHVIAVHAIQNSFSLRVSINMSCLLSAVSHLQSQGSHPWLLHPCACPLPPKRLPSHSFSTRHLFPRLRFSMASYLYMRRISSFLS